jgi:archaellum component FlaC
MRRSVIALFMLTAVAVLGAGCSSDDSSSSGSAQDAVCSDAGDFKDSVNTLVDDVKSGNFGDAKDQMSKVKSSFEDLESSAKDLASSKKSSVQDDLDSVKGTLGDLTSASSLSDIEDTLGEAESELEDAADSITKTLSC